MNNKFEMIMKLFSENEKAGEILKEAKSVEEAVDLLAQMGVEITVEEFKEMGKQLESDELSEDMLEFVAGGKGAGKKVWKAVKDFFHGFFDAF